MDGEATIRGKIEFYGREELVIATKDEVLIIQRSSVSYMIIVE